MPKERKQGASKSKGSKGGGSRQTGKAAGASSSKAAQRVEKPVSGSVSSGYGTRKDPKTGETKKHNGIDIKVPSNTPVKATGDGTVVKAGWENPKDHKQGYGLRVVIDHGNGNTSVYAHNSSLTVKAGDKVKAGDEVSKSGNTGKSTGPHVHYGEYHNGRPHKPTGNPTEYKPKKQTK